MKWWQTTTVYQIYPRSFMDSNGDGIGDIPGILSRLDYIKGLGFETIWLSPPYRGPQLDHGYDIADYRSIDPIFGTMDDMDRLIEGAHARGMRIVMDMIMNHTSSEHPWFVESRSSRDNPRRSWYIWRRGRGRNGKRPPNNWSSMIYPHGWQYDKATGEWYFANFFSFQPDLNYYNPDVKKAMFDNIRFWLGRGVDGFRLDIFHSCFKDDQFRDNPFRFKFFPTETDFDAFFQEKRYTINHPECFTFAKEFRRVLDEFDGDRFAVGEVTGPDDIIKKYVGENHDGLSTVFLFETLMFKFNAAWFGKFLGKVEREYPHPFIPTYVFGNHDQRRLMLKLGNDARKARLIAVFQFTARGIPVTYYGEEIGMRNAKIAIRDAEDPLAKLYTWLPQGIADALGLGDLLIRERARTPMQWNGAAHAGFTGPSPRPWAPVNGDYTETNVENEERDPASLLNAYRALLQLRNTSEALKRGTLKLVENGTGGDNVLVYVREHGGERKAVFLNFSGKTVSARLVEDCTNVLYPAHERIEIGNGSVRLPAYSGIVMGNR